MQIAILTARGGSKRIPRKNVRPFCGKPMLAWPIMAAQASGCFEHIFVSTDDDEIAEIARSYGAEIPYLRPAHLADDFTPAHKAARQMLEWCIDALGPISAFAHIYPTSPFLTAATIREGMTRISKGALFAKTVQKVPFPIFQVETLDNTGQVHSLFPPELATMRSQDMPEAWIDAGQLYCFATQAFLREETAITHDVAFLEIPPERAIDIDTEASWRFAELLASTQNLGCIDNV